MPPLFKVLLFSQEELQLIKLDQDHENKTKMTQDRNKIIERKMQQENKA